MVCQGMKAVALRDLHGGQAMFETGELSRLSPVKARTLHHTDHIGPLQPAKGDRSTGHSHDSAGQLLPHSRILGMICAVAEYGRGGHVLWVT